MRPKVGVGVLIYKDDKVLLGLRKNSHGSGTWHPPGGHLEFGESVEETAIRETLEETGLNIKTLKRGPWTNDIFMEENKHYITVYMVATEFEGQPEVKEPEKCECWQWFDKDNLPSPLFLPLQNFLKQNKI